MRCGAQALGEALVRVDQTSAEGVVRVARVDVGDVLRHNNSVNNSYDNNSTMSYERHNNSGTVAVE